MRVVLPVLLRRHFNLVHVLMLGVAAMLTARATTALAALALPEMRAAAPARSPKVSPVPERSFDPALGAMMFEVPLRSADPPGRAPTCDDADDTVLPLRLVGASVFAEPSLSLASIVVDERRGAQAAIYAPNDLIEGRARVIAIAPDQVCVLNLQSGALEQVTSSPAATRPAAPTAAPASASAPGPTGDRLLDALATGARVVPRFEDGKLTGVKLFSVKPGSLYAAAGLRNGDTVVAINGRTVADPSQALTLWAELKDERSVEVAIVRHGEPITLTAAIPTW